MQEARVVTIDQEFEELQKSRVKAHVSKTKTGKLTRVKEYSRAGDGKPTYNNPWGRGVSRPKEKTDRAAHKALEWALTEVFDKNEAGDIAYKRYKKGSSKDYLWLENNIEGSFRVATALNAQDADNNRVTLDQVESYLSSVGASKYKPPKRRKYSSYSVYD